MSQKKITQDTRKLIHDINNPLAIIQLGIVMIRRLLAEPAPNVQAISEQLDRMDHTVGRIAIAVQALRLLSKEGDAQGDSQTSPRK